MDLSTPVAPPANSAAPGTTKPPKEKKVAAPRAKLIKHPALTDAQGNPVLLTEQPADFNSAIHSPLKKSNFVSEVAFLEDWIKRQEAKVAKAKTQVEQLKTLGSSAHAAQAKSLIKMRAKMKELEALLAAGGFDLSKLGAPEESVETTEAQS